MTDEAPAAGLRLRVRELATDQHLSLQHLQIKSGLNMTTVRRYWYDSRDGAQGGEPLRELDRGVLQALATALGVAATALFVQASSDPAPEPESEGSE